ncbi:MAG: bifunctional diguanylate cyclase/phosphodiesterase, partial [Clostridiales bacterium]|nr:bifunctional diguanylate cyclase/phosphodiesterase [Clostridiales bacterium]
LLFVDTDNFKYINDVLGHNAGDMMLREIGQRLAMLQEKDRTFICRVGGDEFVIVFYGLTETEAIVRKTKEMMEAFEKPFDINGKKLNLTISVGITRYPEDGSTVEKLLKNADIAMYKAKEKGKDCFCFFEASMEEAAARRANMENHLRKAVDNGEMLLYYQPQINIMENRLIGFEALVRWNSPIFGMVSPAQFIPIAEDTGIIINLGKWILKNACDFARELNRRRPGEPKFISVNISPLQINNSDFTGIIQRIIEDSDIEPGMLGIEITETALLESFDTVAGKIETLGKMGIKISLDDFGMGFSSLNHLRTLSIDTVKIDKSFIDDIVKDDKSYIMTEAIINLSHKLGVQIVAEGVEESEQVEILKEYGCDAIQGYFFSRPIPEREAIEFMKNDKGTGVLS